MSRLEKGAKALDDHRLKRLIIQDSDFDNYLNERDGDEHIELKSPDYFIDDVLDYFANGGALQGDKVGFEKIDNRFRLGEGQVTIWQGINGHGKSLFLGQVFQNLMAQDKKVCIVSPEMSPVSLIARMTRQCFKSEFPEPEGIKAWCMKAVGKLWIYDFQNTVTEDRLMSLLLYASEKLGIQHILIDSLMKVQSIAEDDYNGQKSFVNKLCMIARQTKCHLHLVAHSRKGSTEDEKPDKMSVLGSSSITNLCDNCVAVWRNKPKERIDPLQMTEEEERMFDAHIIIQKNRHGDGEGEYGLFFDSATQLYRDRYER
jgi:twinkle protein